MIYQGSRIPIALAALAVATVAGASDIAPPEPVSPGARAETSEIGAPCPTFSWGANVRNGKLELVVFELDPGNEEPDIVIQEKLSASARTWTPGLAQCLAWGGEYGWFLRRLEDEPSPWSEPRYFALPEAPTEAQAARAAQVLQRYLEHQPGAGFSTAAGLSGAPALVGPGPEEQGPASGPDSRTSASRDTANLPDVVKLSGSLGVLKRLSATKATNEAALRGIQGATAGEAYGLWGESPSPDGGGVVGKATATSGDPAGVAGTSDAPLGAGVLGMAAAASGTNAGVRGTASSPDGAGVLAENLSGGPDLVLGGGTEAAFTESGLTVESASDVSFALTNTGTGKLVLTVDGAPLTASTCSRFLLLTGINADGSPVCRPLPVGLALTADDGGGNDVGSNTSIALRDDGTPVISYLDDTNRDLMVFDCADAACSTGTARTVDGGTDEVGFTSSIAVRGDGTPVISYYDLTNGDLKVFDCDDAGCSSGTARTVDGSGGTDVGLFTSLAVRTDGTPVISYYDRTNGNLKILDCGNADCSSGIDRTADATDDVGLDTSLAIRDDGTPVIGYHDATNVDLKVYDCDDAACSSGTARTAVNLGSVGEDTGIAVRDDGTPVISYYDAGNGNLNVFDCDNTGCSSGNPITVDGDGGDDVGQHTSIAVRDDGAAVISYFDETNDSLKIFDCDKQACSFGVARTVDDGSGDLTGTHTSIAVRDDGTPVISYHSRASNGALKVFSCGDQDCAR